MKKLLLNPTATHFFLYDKLGLGKDLLVAAKNHHKYETTCFSI